MMALCNLTKNTYVNIMESFLFRIYNYNIIIIINIIYLFDQTEKTREIKVSIFRI